MSDRRHRGGVTTARLTSGGLAFDEVCTFYSGSKRYYLITSAYDEGFKNVLHRPRLDRGFVTSLAVTHLRLRPTSCFHARPFFEMHFGNFLSFRLLPILILIYRKRFHKIRLKLFKLVVSFGISKLSIG